MGLFKLTQLAKNDLVDIGSYTVEMWGYDQAEKYLAALDEAFGTLADKPDMAERREDIRSGLLASRCRRHLIFFRKTKAGGVEVLRILHERRDHKRHF